MLCSLSNKEIRIFTQAIDEYYCKPNEIKDEETNYENYSFENYNTKSLDITSNTIITDTEPGNEDPDLILDIHQSFPESSHQLKLMNNEENMKLTFFLVNDWFKRILLIKNINLISKCPSQIQNVKISGQFISKRLIFEKGD